MNILNMIIELILSLFSKKAGTDAVVAPTAPVVDPEPLIIQPISFTLKHTRFCSDGIFGQLYKSDGTHVTYTLEHSYNNLPKLANGTYTCKRGPHRLNGMTEDFITFEITGIPDFNGVPVTHVLFHWGNYNKDSEGCVLLGATDTDTMVTSSKETWANFMTSLEGVDSFQLVVLS